MSKVKPSFMTLPFASLTDEHANTVRIVDPTDNETKMKLADIYEVLGETRRALDLVYEGT